MANDKLVTKTLKISQIIAETSTQARVCTDDSIVADYAEQMKLGANFPPVEVVRDERSGKFYLVDGFHRVAAARVCGVALIGAVVIPGTLAEARWMSTGKNKEHGLRRTNADKQNAGRKALMARPDLTDSVIAKHVGVSQSSISHYRRELVAGGVIEDVKERIGLDGRKVDGDKIRARRQAIATAASKQAAKYMHCPTCRGSGMIKVLK